MTGSFELRKFNITEQDVIVPYLKKRFGLVSSVCCLYHMIAQGEDIYTYFINGERVVTLEVSRMDNSVIADDSITVESYAKMKKGRQYHRYLKELLELSQRDDFQI